MVDCFLNKIHSQILRDYRIKKGFSQGDVASQLEVTRQYISQIERGVRPVPKGRVLIKLLDLYKIKPKYFESLVKMELEKK